MTGCPLCGAYNTSISQLLVHMRVVHAREPGFRVQCGIQGCPRSFKNFGTFRNHVYAIHGASLALETETNAEEPETSDHEHNDEGDGIQDERAVEADIVTEEAVRRAAALLILKIREGHRIPQSVMDEIVADVSSLYHLALSAIRQQVKATLNDAGVENGIIESTMCHLSAESPLTNIFSGLGNHYQQLQYFKKNFDLVISEEWDALVLLVYACL